MTDRLTSTPRTQTLKERREQAGWLRLSDWLEPDIAQILKARCQAEQKTRAQVIADLLRASIDS